jgi:hypothetical protein
MSFDHKNDNTQATRDGMTPWREEEVNGQVNLKKVMLSLYLTN